MSKELELLSEKQWPNLDYRMRYGMVKIMRPLKPFREEWEAVCIKKQKIDFHDDTQTIHRTK